MADTKTKIIPIADGDRPAKGEGEKMEVRRKARLGPASSKARAYAEVAAKIIIGCNEQLISSCVISLDGIAREQGRSQEIGLFCNILFGGGILEERRRPALNLAHVGKFTAEARAKTLDGS